MCPREDDETLHGPVESVRIEEVTVAARDGRPPAETRRSSVVTYNQQGTKAQVSFYQADNSLHTKTVYAYDAGGHLASATSYDADNALLLEQTFADGKPTELTEYGPGGTLRAKTLYLYDIKGRLTYSARFNADGSLAERQELRYDAAGDRVEEHLLSPAVHGRDVSFHIANAKGETVDVGTEGVCLFKVWYDAESNPLRAGFYDRRRRLIIEYLFMHDAQGNLAQVDEYAGPAYLAGEASARGPLPLHKLFLFLKPVCTYAARSEFRNSVRALFQETPIAKRLYSHDGAGRIIAIQQQILGSPAATTKYTYDADGHLSEETQHSAAGSLLRHRNFVREFDERGNWISRVVSETSTSGQKGQMRVTTTTSRTIEYL